MLAHLAHLSGLEITAAENTLRRAQAIIGECTSSPGTPPASLAHIPSPPGLTPAEQKIFALAIEGLVGKDIANELGISLSTVKEHLQHIRKKAGVKTTPELAAHYAVRNAEHARLFQNLPKRQKEVLTYMAAGYKISQIASIMRISETTVDTHFKKARAKTNLQSRAQLVALVPPDAPRPRVPTIPQRSTRL